MAIMTNELPVGVLEALKKRHTVEQIRAMSPAQAFDEFCTANGLMSWGPTLRKAWSSLVKAQPHTGGN